ncbi:hypothetical protein A0O28_0000040 [Trichoderma guizhouense]|uniref:Uncharacterized protein n=1 Tax=Trichoderma guizhouense TaxID=1491466 RepID=A0A1T3CG38_9HYPO|nr:hypothetical protein A0O28_0000040 [Trichoderma guizhouense]
MAKVQVAKTDKSTTTVGCTVMAKPQPDGHKIDENHTTLGCTVMAKPKARQHKIDENHTTLGCNIIDTLPWRRQTQLQDIKFTDISLTTVPWGLRRIAARFNPHLLLAPNI